jgi:hypothetical protein
VDEGGEVVSTAHVTRLVGDDSFELSVIEVM